MGGRRLDGCIGTIGTDQRVGNLVHQNGAAAHTGHRDGGRADRTVGSGNGSSHTGHRIVGVTTPAAQLVIG